MGMIDAIRESVESTATRPFADGSLTLDFPPDEWAELLKDWFMLKRFDVEAKPPRPGEAIVLMCWPGQVVCRLAVP